MRGVYAILLAAGSGQRMEAGENKVLLKLGGHTVVYNAMSALEKSGVFEKVILVVKEGEQKAVEHQLSGISIPYNMVTGGKERQDSVKNALDALPTDAETVAIHDAARCLAAPWLIRNCVDSAAKYGSGVAGRKVYDTVKTTENGCITGTVDREKLILIETPQAFSVPLIKDAYEKAYADGFYGTDDSMLLERLGKTVKLVLSEDVNIKLTKPDDMGYAEFVLGRRESMRIGQGFDAHRFEKGRKLVLGGVNIDYEYGLKGHSDADVLIHAIMDALLGAAGLKDIGTQFPDSDQRFKDIYSIELLRQVGELLTKEDAEIENIDATLIMERPKVAPYIDAMCENIANALKISRNKVAIKATTTEGMGFTGTKEGAAASAVCLVKKLG